MKKKLLLVLLLIFTLSMTMLITGCGGQNESAADQSGTAETEEAAETEEPAESSDVDNAAGTEEPAAALTFEEFAKNDSSIQEKLGVDEESGVSVTIKGNELIYSYDYSKMEGDYTEEQIKSEEVKSAIKDAMAENGAVFGNIAKVMEEASSIEGISVTVEYTWEGDPFYSETFTSKDAE